MRSGQPDKVYYISTVIHILWPGPRQEEDQENRTGSPETFSPVQGLHI